MTANSRDTSHLKRVHASPSAALATCHNTLASNAQATNLRALYCDIFALKLEDGRAGSQSGPESDVITSHAVRWAHEQ
jgi:hypothetical protein